jgi:hypothetical protein
MVFRVKNTSGGRLIYKGNEVIAVDTPIMDDLYPQVLNQLKGCVLVAGLGLGVGVKYICNLSAVEHVTCLEVAPEVILLSPVRHQKLRIVEADAWFWVPDMQFDAVWIDIYCDLLRENLLQEQLLMARYAMYGIPLQIGMLEEYRRCVG